MTQVVNNLPVMQETQENEIKSNLYKFTVILFLSKVTSTYHVATHSNILAWRIPWTEEPVRLQSIWSQRVGHD